MRKMATLSLVRHVVVRLAVPAAHPPPLCCAPVAYPPSVLPRARTPGQIYTIRTVEDFWGVYNNVIEAAEVPNGTTGAPFTMEKSELSVLELPPTKQVVSCK